MDEKIDDGDWESLVAGLSTRERGYFYCGRLRTMPLWCRDGHGVPRGVRRVQKRSPSEKDLSWSRLATHEGKREGERERDEIKSRGQIILVSHIKLRWTSVSDVGTPRDGRTIQRDYPVKTRGRNAFMAITTSRYGGRHVRDKTNLFNVNLFSKESTVKRAFSKGNSTQSIHYRSTYFN